VSLRAQLMNHAAPDHTGCSGQENAHGTSPLSSSWEFKRSGR
jgi:hypothetical protein